MRSFLSALLLANPSHISFIPIYVILGKGSVYIDGNSHNSSSLTLYFNISLT